MKRMIWIGIVSAILGIIAAQVLFSVALAQDNGMSVLRRAPVIPPAEYDHPFRGVVTVARIDNREKLDAIYRNRRVLGCALLHPGGCHIIAGDDAVLAASISQLSYAQVYRHEIGTLQWMAGEPSRAC